MSESGNLFAQQEANRRRSRRLVIGFILFFAWLGFGGDFILYEYTKGAAPGAYHHVFPFLGIFLSIIAAGMAWWAWTTGPKRVLWSTGARELTDPQTPQEKQLDNVVQEMSVASGLPKPKIWIIPDADPNALATGHDENTSSIAITQGLLDLCSRDELQAVIAHEMGHIKNLDVRLMTQLAALVGAVTLIGSGVSRTMFYGGNSFGGGRRSSSSNNDNRGGGGVIVVVLLVLWIVSWILAPIIMRLMALGVSRDREYLADAMSAQYTRNPLSLATALGKIEGADAPTKSIKGGAAQMCIADPTGRHVNSKEGKLAELFGTHPPMALRIARLKAMGYQTEPGAIAG
ncbi:MAG: M48 family metallopeptidase [Gemmatimonadaceae bacterium]